jgi:hypothetical protein
MGRLMVIAALSIAWLVGCASDLSEREAEEQRDWGATVIAALGTPFANALTAECGSSPSPGTKATSTPYPTDVSAFLTAVATYRPSPRTNC